MLGTIEHADALRTALLAPGADVVVAGAGFIGLEVAATAVALGAASVTVIASGAGPLDRFGAAVGDAVRTMHEARGVRFVTHGRVERVERDGDGTATGVRLLDGRTVPGAVVVAGVGSFPNTGWLDGSGLVLGPNRAIACDATGLAAPGVRAAGDCAAWAGEACAHWTLAQQQAERVGHDLAAPGSGPALRDQPYLWSDQHGSRLQFAGRLRGGETVSLDAGSVEDGDPYFVFRDAAGREAAVLGIGQARRITRWRKLNRAPLVATGEHEPV